MIKTLAIETSCDDTSLSIVSFDGKYFSVDALLAYSQIDDHQKYWGVVPEFASRLHSEKILAVLQNIGLEKIKAVDFISVTTHPWLPGSLVVGKALASFLAKQFDKPLVEVNHIYGHLFSLFLERNVKDIQLPLVVLTASGGHNDIYYVDDWGLRIALTGWKDWEFFENWKLKIENSCVDFHKFWGFRIAKLWHTLDDAAGECFDKVARMLWWPYPWWQWISEMASKHGRWRLKVEGWKVDIAFKRIFLSKDWYDFSFSGMKSQVSFLLQQLEKKWTIERLNDGSIKISEQLICDIAYEFQEAVVEVLVKKLIRAGIAFDAKTIGIAWGVSCNDRLREYLNEYWEKMKDERSKTKDVVFLRPMKKIYSMDNGAMIWLAGILEWITDNG